MNKDEGHQVWRYQELEDGSNTNDNSNQNYKSDKKKFYLPLNSDSKCSVKNETQKTTKVVTSEATSKLVCSTLQDQNVILVKNIRLLKVQVYKPKNSGKNVSLSKHEKGNTSLVPVTPKNISSTNSPSELEAASSCQIYMDKRLGVKSKMESNFIGPSERWPSKPKSYRGAKKIVQMPLLCTDTTDGETSGMGSSVDEVFESSTESEATSSFLPPKTNSYRSFPPPTKKRRGGWPKGRKRNPNMALTKNSYPKSPTTAYGYFLIERHKFYQNIEPTIPIAFLSKILGAEWKHLSEEEKAVYVTRSEKDKQRYRNDVKSYRLSRENQLVLRKKRAKTSTMKEKKSTGEESSDGTDEVDDEESRGLYCKTCDQWFTSLHNKREHLYGRYHLQALKEGQPKTWNSRWKSKPTKSVTFADDEDSPNGASSSALAKSESEDDVSMSTGDEQASKSDGPSYRESTTEEEDESQSVYPDRVSDCLQAVVSKVYDREKERQWLTEHLKRNQKHQDSLFSTLSALEKKRKELQNEHDLSTATTRMLTRELQALWKLPMAVDPSHYSKSRCSTVRLLEETNALESLVEEEPKQSTSETSVEIGSSSVANNLSPFSTSDLNNFDLENFSSSILGDDIDFNLFASDFFADLEQNVKDNEDT